MRKRHRLYLVLATISIAAIAACAPTPAAAPATIVIPTAPPVKPMNTPVPTAVATPASSPNPAAPTNTPVSLNPVIPSPTTRSGRQKPNFVSNQIAAKYVQIDPSICNNAHESPIVTQATKRNLPEDVVEIVPLGVDFNRQMIQLWANPKNPERTDVPSNAVWFTELHLVLGPDHELASATLDPFWTSTAEICLYNFWGGATFQLTNGGIILQGLEMWTKYSRTGIRIKPVIEFR